MVFFEWTEKISVGIDRIDNQHKRFMKILNNAYEKSSSESLTQQTERLSEVLDYARVHFSTEEAILDRYLYPYSDEHKLEHLKILQKATQLFDQSRTGTKQTTEVLVFLKEWFEEHLKKHDFKYAKYFKDNKINAY
jgi:hemerythrin-like metal-binding protein